MHPDPVATQSIERRPLVGTSARIAQMSVFGEQISRETRA
jgi:hypothetical protein